MHEWLLSLPSAERNRAHSDQCDRVASFSHGAVQGYSRPQAVITGSVEKISPIAQRPSRNVHPDKSTGLVRDCRTCTHSSFTLPLAEARADAPSHVTPWPMPNPDQIHHCWGSGRGQLAATYLSPANSGLRKKGERSLLGSISLRKSITFHPPHQPLCKTVIALMSLHRSR